MKNIPERIYLQISSEDDIPSDFNEVGGILWCKDKIYDSDLEYKLIKRKDNAKESPKKTRD